MYNRELEKIDNQVKAYVYGLFYADGNVHTKKNTVRLLLHNNDTEILTEIIEHFPFFKLYKSNKREHSTILATNKLLKLDFISNGCFPRKSKDNKEFLLVPPISTELLPHFIRGYFDGDGGCTVNAENKKQVQKRVYIHSASFNFLKGIESILIENGIECSFLKEESVYKITIRTRSYKDFFNFIYKDSIINMRRKYDLFSYTLTFPIFIQQKAPNCKFCNSSHTVFNGNTFSKGIEYRRILCRNCNKITTTNILTGRSSSNARDELDELLET